MSRAKRGTAPAAAPAPIAVERVQTGLRIEKRMLKVLKAVAELHDLGLGDLLEGVVLHAFEGRCAFGPDTLARIADLKRVYGLELDAGSAHRLVERGVAGEGAALSAAGAAPPAPGSRRRSSA